MRQRKHWQVLPSEWLHSGRQIKSAQLMMEFHSIIILSFYANLSMRFAIQTTRILRSGKIETGDKRKKSSTTNLQLNSF